MYAPPVTMLSISPILTTYASGLGSIGRHTFSSFARRVQDFQAAVVVLKEEGDGAEVGVCGGSVLRLVGVAAGVGGGGGGAGGGAGRRGPYWRSCTGGTWILPLTIPLLVATPLPLAALVSGASVAPTSSSIFKVRSLIAL